MLESLKLGPFYVGTVSHYERPLSEEEMQHLEKLLTAPPTTARKICIQQKSRDGSDGESFTYALLRRKDGKTPRKLGLRDLYDKGFCLGFLNFDPKVVEFIRTLQDRGVEVDNGLKRLIRELGEQPQRETQLQIG